MQAVIDWVMAHYVVVFGVCYVLLNEAVVLSPSLKANSIVQVLLPFLQKYNPPAA